MALSSPTIRFRVPSILRIRDSFLPDKLFIEYCINESVSLLIVSSCFISYGTFEANSSTRFYFNFSGTNITGQSRRGFVDLTSRGLFYRFILVQYFFQSLYDFGVCSINRFGFNHWEMTIVFIIVRIITIQKNPQIQPMVVVFVVIILPLCFKFQQLEPYKKEQVRMFLRPFTK